MSLPRRPVHLTRRSALGLAVAGVASACTSSPSRPATGAKRATAGNGAAQVPGVDPDVRLAGEALATAIAGREFLDAVIRRHHDLRRVLAPVRAMHAAHAEALAAAVPGHHDVAEAPTAHVPRTRSRVVRALVAHEHGALSQHTDQAMRAASGPFARLLAGMSAGCAQRVRLLGELADHPDQQQHRRRR